MVKPGYMAGQEQTREQAKAWAREHVAGCYTNAETGWTIEVSSKGIAEAAQHPDWNSPTALQTLAAIPELVRVAVPVQTEPDKQGRPDIRQVHTLVAPS